MHREIYQLDHDLIRLLQQLGMTKKEARAYLKKAVYCLSPEDIQKIKNYDNHFGTHAKSKLIEEILDLRRETLLNRLTRHGLTDIV